MIIRRAELDDLDLVAPLFDAYRHFYERGSNIELARQFIGERLRNGDSTILIAMENEGAAEAMGFTQLYPTFSSVRARPVLVLNDLFVAEAHKRKGVGKQLMVEAARFALDAGVDRLSLETATDNIAAQALYESLGWKRSAGFLTYNLERDQFESAD